MRCCSPFGVRQLQAAANLAHVCVFAFGCSTTPSAIYIYELLLFVEEIDKDTGKTQMHRGRRDCTGAAATSVKRALPAILRRTPD